MPLAYEPADVIITGIVDEVLSSIDRLLKGTEEISPRVCIVIDGEPLPAKQGTHKTRARRSYQHLKFARRLVRNYLGLPPAARTAYKQQQFLTRFHKSASGWVRWWSHLKVGIAAKLVERGWADGFTVDGPRFSVVTAPFEADPKVVDVASSSRDSAIISPDGDLHVYPFADDALVSRIWVFLDSLSSLIVDYIYPILSQRVTRVDWDTGKVSYTTKRRLLASTGFLNETVEVKDEELVGFQLKILGLLLSGCVLLRRTQKNQTLWRCVRPTLYFFFF